MKTSTPKGEFGRPFGSSEALSFNSEHLLRSENLPFDIDNWYPQLKQCTFETVFLPLSRGEGRALIRAYRFRFLSSGFVGIEDAEALRRLEDRIDDAICDHFAATGCFMRLCGRSAKDGDPLDRGRVQREYKEALERIAGLPGGPSMAPSAAVKMQAAMAVEVLRCWTGAEVMSILLSSERVYSDMLDWLWFGEPEQIVLRRWEDGLTQDLEFRLYVHDNRVTAISQYDHYCRHEHLFSLRDKLQVRMEKFWQEVHPLVGVASYAVDVGYLPVSDRLVLVELSPFLRCTGAHCFRWSNPVDVDVLEGRSPFEFRLVENTVPFFEEVFCTNWDERWSDTSAVEAFWESYETPIQRRTHSWTRWFNERFSRFHCRHRQTCGKWTLLFVYGTLKRGMQWNSKFLCDAHFSAEVVTFDCFPLVVGACGVPYLLLDRKGHGHHVRGELWSVNADALEGLDQYEGVDKGYYTRSAIQVEASGKLCEAQVYTMAKSPDEFSCLPHLEEYTLEHHQGYNAVVHIQLKQQLYLQGNVQYAHPDNARHQPKSLLEDVAASSVELLDVQDGER